MKLAQEYGLYIGGRWRRTGSAFESRNPAAPDEILGVFAAADRAAAEDAFAAAAETGGAWRLSPAPQRAAMLDAAAEVLLAGAAGLSEDIAREQGKTLADARAEVAHAGRFLRSLAAVCAESSETVGGALNGDAAYSLSEPFGVVCVITPPQSPVGWPLRKLATALASGNTVVWSPSELTPLCAYHLTQVFEGAGLPAGALNMIGAAGEQSDSMLTDQQLLDAVAFAGSLRRGRAIQASLLSRGIPVQVEVPADNPVIVLADATLDHAVRYVVRRALTAVDGYAVTSRAVVHGSLIEPFVERVTAAAASLCVGDPLDGDTEVGPLPSAADVEGLERVFAAAGYDGLTPVIGGERLATESGGYFVEPTVYVDVSSDSTLGRQEVAGPVLAVVEASSLAESVEIANLTPSLRAPSVFTHDLRAVHAFARGARAAAVYVNGGVSGHVPATLRAAVPARGRAWSSVATAIDDVVETKSVYVAAP